MKSSIRAKNWSAAKKHKGLIEIAIVHSVSIIFVILTSIIEYFFYEMHLACLSSGILTFGPVTYLTIS